MPVSMRATSSRSLIRSRIRSLWDLMMRMNCTISAESRELKDSSMVSTDPLMEVRGARSSWLTIPRNSARIFSSSFRAVISCRVTTTVSTSLSSSERNGVALTRTVIDRPSGTLRTISSARTVSPLLSTWARGKVRQGHRLPLEAPDGKDLQQVFRGTVGQPHGLHEPRRLPVEGDRHPRPGVEDRHAHGGGVDQRLQARPGALFVPIPAGVGDDQRRMGGEQHQRLLVLLRIFTFLLVEVDGAQVLAPVADGSSQKGHEVRGGTRADPGSGRGWGSPAPAAVSEFCRRTQRT